MWFFFWACLKKTNQKETVMLISLYCPFSLCCLSLLRSADNFNENPILTFLFSKTWMKTLNCIKFLWTLLFLFQGKIFIHNFNVNNVLLRFRLIFKLVISYEVWSFIAQYRWWFSIMKWEVNNCDTLSTSALQCLRETTHEYSTTFLKARNRTPDLLNTKRAAMLGQ